MTSLPMPSPGITATRLRDEEAVVSGMPVSKLAFTVGGCQMGNAEAFAGARTASPGASRLDEALERGASLLNLKQARVGIFKVAEKFLVAIDGFRLFSILFKNLREIE